MKYRSKIVEIDAVQWTGNNLDRLLDFAGSRILGNPEMEMGILIDNKIEEIAIPCPVGHWVIRGLEGEYYPCADSVFQKKYEAVT